MIFNNKDIFDLLVHQHQIILSIWTAKVVLRLNSKFNLKRYFFIMLVYFIPVTFIYFHKRPIMRLFLKYDLRMFNRCHIF